MLILLFLANMSYLYGSLFRSGYRVNALNILAVDYDGGYIGQAVSAAYGELESDEFPRVNFRSAAGYPTIDNVRNAVCKGDYWGAIVTQPGASSRLSQALGGGTAAAGYDASDTVTLVYNSAHYAAVELGDVVGNLQTRLGATTAAYYALNGTQALAYLNTADTNATQAFFNPISSSVIDIMPTSQGSRVLYNTVSIVLPIIQQFFFVMALNGINTQFGIYVHLNTTRIALIKMIVSYVYTFLASLTVSGYIWAFREGWGLNGNQFVSLIVRACVYSFDMLFLLTCVRSHLSAAIVMNWTFLRHIANVILRCWHGWLIGSICTRTSLCSTR